jgi:fructokinase
MMTEFTVVGLGELLWDLLPDGRQLGGAPANFAYHAGALGAKAVIVSCVGDDESGREIVELLGRKGLDLSYLATDPEHPTGTVSVELGEHGKPCYVIHENVAWDFIPPSQELRELAPRTDAVCFGSLAQRSFTSRQTIREFLGSTKPDCLRIFDVNLRQTYYDEAIIRDSLSLSNVLKLSEDELPVAADLLSIEGEEHSALGRLQDRFALRVIALTRGDRGCLIRTAERTAEHRGFPQERIADTVGAGDSFAAALAVGLLRNQELDAICSQANRLAGYVCSQKGAMPPRSN